MSTGSPGQSLRRPLHTLPVFLTDLSFDKESDSHHQTQEASLLTSVFMTITVYCFFTSFTKIPKRLFLNSMFHESDKPLF